MNTLHIVTSCFFSIHFDIAFQPKCEFRKDAFEKWIM